MPAPTISGEPRPGIAIRLTSSLLSSRFRAFMKDTLGTSRLPSEPSWTAATSPVGAVLSPTKKYGVARLLLRGRVTAAPTVSTPPFDNPSFRSADASWLALDAGTTLTEDDRLATPEVSSSAPLDSVQAKLANAF